MKDKKLIILYVLMLILGFALLYTNISKMPKSVVEKVPVETPVQTNVTKIVTVAVAKKDIDKRTIITADDYYFKTIEVNRDEFDQSKYVSSSTEIDTYVAKSNVQKESIIQRSFIVSPMSSEYFELSLKDGEYIFPIDIGNADSYLLSNLQGGDLIDIYILYGTEKNSGRSSNITFVSPGQTFVSTNIKPIIIAKKILFIETDNIVQKNRQQPGKISLVLSNDEIKLLRTLMTNATVMLYPSKYRESQEDGLSILNDKEKGWPESQEQLFNRVQINRLRGN